MYGQRQCILCRKKKGVVLTAAVVPKSERGREERNEQVGEGSRYTRPWKGCESKERPWLKTLVVMDILARGRALPHLARHLILIIVAAGRLLHLLLQVSRGKVCCRVVVRAFSRSPILPRLLWFGGMPPHVPWSSWFSRTACSLCSR
jgi:hypothetical protein